MTTFALTYPTIDPVLIEIGIVVHQGPAVFVNDLPPRRLANLM